MLVPSEKSHYSSYSDSDVSFNKIVDEKKWLPWLKENKILYYLSAGYDTSESEGEFPVVNCLCSGEIDDRCAGLRWGEERNMMNVSNA